MPDFSVETPFLAYDYCIFLDGTRVKAKNGKTGVIESSHATDADVVLQYCLDHLSAGGTIVMGVGTFTIAAAVSSTNSVNIIGSGRGRTILKRTVSAATSTLTMNGANITISSLTLDGNYPTNTSNIFQELGCNASNVLVQDVEVKAFTNIGIANMGSSYMSIDRCIITGANVALISDIGIYIDSGTTVIRGCNITNCALNGVFADGKTTVDGCYFSNNARSAGGQIAAASGNISMIVTNNTIDPDASLGSGVEASSATNAGEWIITNNRISGQHHYGIVTNPDPNVNIATIITDNIIKNCTEGAIMILGSQHDLVITGNLCFDDQGTATQKYGIWIDTPVVDRYVVKDNICYRNTLADFTDVGAGMNKLVKDNIGKPILSTKRSGSYLPAAGTTAATVGQLDGILAQHTITAGGSNTNTLDTTEGILINLVSAASTTTNVGLVSPTVGVGIGRRLFGMRVAIRAKIDSTTNGRFLFGFTSATALPTSGAPLATTDHGLIVGFIETGTGSTNWSIFHNDGATSVTTDNVTGPIAKDALFHTIEINWVASGNVTVIFDGKSQTVNTDLPATTANLFFNAVVQTSSSTARSLIVRGIQIEVDS